MARKKWHSDRRRRLFGAELDLLLQRQEGGVAAGGGGVGRHRALGGEAVQVAGTAGLGAGAGEAFAAEGLHPDDGADHAAVDVAVADPEPSPRFIGQGF
jgi:hypothetical protein